MPTPITHWKSLAETDPEFYGLCYERAVEIYGEKVASSEQVPVQIHFSLGFMDGLLTLDQVNDDARHIFGWGACSFFAMALHELTGLPLALFTAPEAQGGNWEDWSGHAAVALPDGNFLDITGVVSAAAISSRYGFEEIVEPTILGWEDYLEAQFGDRTVADPFRALEPLELRMLRHHAEIVAREAGIDQK